MEDSIYPLLNQKKADPQQLVALVTKDSTLVDDLVVCLKERDHVIRENAFNALVLMCDEQSELVYPHWDYFVEMLNSKNAFHKSIGIYMLAPLTRADTEHRVDQVLDQLLDSINDKSVVVASNLARNIGKLLMNRPDLETKVFARIIPIDDSAQTQHVEIVKGHIVEGLLDYYPHAQDPSTIENFVRQQRNSGSPSTRKRAEQFLEKIASA